MFTARKKLTLPLTLILLACFASMLIAGDKKKNTKKSSQSPQMEEARRVQHALNRITFGPRPGDVQKVEAMGVDTWIERQLRPEKIDDSALEARLAPLRTLQMNTKEMVQNFPPQQLIKAVAEGRVSMPSDPEKRAVYQAQVDRYRKTQELKQKAAANTNGAQDQVDENDTAKPKSKLAGATEQDRDDFREARMYADLDSDRLASLPPKERVAEIIRMEPMERLALSRGTNQGQNSQILAGLSPQQKELIESIDRPQAVVTNELMEGKLLRAIYSERQLDEVMTDFWFNHFNVFVGKGPDRYLITSYEREAIRPHSLGKFKDLLLATAKNPAMLFYLDNAQSIGPNSQATQGRKPDPLGNNRGNNTVFGRRNRRFGPVFNQSNARPRQAQQKKQARGLNENYAREVMELHTLGVDGGYTQKDVTELAKVLTGWTLKRDKVPAKAAYGGDFEFNEKLHEPGKKVVLGQTFKEDGEKEGIKALEMLAHHPSTARFISTKLAMRFVSDKPPAALVDRMAETFTKSDGDIREVLRTLFTSPEFWAPEAYRAKVKTPLEFVVSAVRAGNVEVSNALPLAQALNRMGMPLYGMQPPTGYSMKAETWVNSAALLNRMNFALALGANRLNGMKFDAKDMLGADGVPQTAEAALPVFEHAILDADISQDTHNTILKQISDPLIVTKTAQQARAGAATANAPVPEYQDSDSGDQAMNQPPKAIVPVNDNPGAQNKLAVIAGLIMGSPEFQRR